MFGSSGKIVSGKYNFCNSQLKTTTDKFIWTIDNFSKRKLNCGECLQSQYFTSKSPDNRHLEWQMKIFPKGRYEELKDYISFCLFLVNSTSREIVQTKYQLSIRKSEGDEYLLSPMNEESHDLNCSCTKVFNNKLIKRESLLDEKNCYLNGDRLIIVCKLVVEQEFDEIASLPDVEVPECRGMEDVSQLFEKSLLTDCKIVSEDKNEYKVHKCILACQSPVFAAMFEHRMIEKNNNVVNILDIKGNIIEKMLRFMYSGKEPVLGEMAKDLLIAADKYKLTRLKLLCERQLINTLGSATACGLLLFANLYSAENLKTHAINFIKIYGNEVMKSEGWKTLANEEMKDQILKAVMEK